MKYLNIYMLLLSGIFMLSSCEDVIELELKDETPRVIIEAQIDANKATANVSISKSNGFYDQAQQVFFDNADVRIQKVGEQEIVLEKNEEGIYAVDNLNIVTGQTWQVKVSLDGVDYEATSYVPNEVELLKIDTTTFTPPFGGSGQTFYQMFSEWQDKADSEDYYRLKTYSNGEYLVGSYFLYNDANADGNLFLRPLMQIFEPGNLYRIELLSLDKSSFEYFRELSTIQSQGGGASVPFNPIGNFSNGALGYFGVSYSSSIEIQL